MRLEQLMKEAEAAKQRLSTRLSKQSSKLSADQVLKQQRSFYRGIIRAVSEAERSLLDQRVESSDDQELDAHGDSWYGPQFDAAQAAASSAEFRLRQLTRFPDIESSKDPFQVLPSANWYIGAKIRYETCSKDIEDRASGRRFRDESSDVSTVIYDPQREVGSPPPEKISSRGQNCQKWLDCISDADGGTTSNQAVAAFHEATLDPVLDVPESSLASVCNSETFIKVKRAARRRDANPRTARHRRKAPQRSVQSSKNSPPTITRVAKSSLSKARQSKPLLSRPVTRSRAGCSNTMLLHGI